MAVQNSEPHPDITRTTLAVLSIAALVVAAFWIIEPFLIATVWATTIVVATWPVLLRVEKLLWGKRRLAAIAMTALLVLVFVVPLVAALLTLVANTDRIVGWAKLINTLVLPAPPQWLETLPIVGPKLSAAWSEIAIAGTSELSTRVAPYARNIVAWLLGQAGNVGRMILEFLLTAIIAGILYTTGETAGRGLLRFAHRLAGNRGQDAMILAARSVRAVALGVVVTAIVQSTLGGIGLVASGVPAASVLTVVMFMLCLAQIGPGLVLFPVVIWLFWSGHPVWGIFMGVWSLFVGIFDNFLRPVLIRKGADLSLLLIFPGVIGGLIALGVIGIFIGPVVLAVTYTLLRTWVSEPEALDLPPETEKGYPSSETEKTGI